MNSSTIPQTIPEEGEDLSALFSLENLMLYEAEDELEAQRKVVNVSRLMLDHNGNVCMTEDHYRTYKDPPTTRKQDPFNLFDERISPTKKLVRKEDLQFNSFGVSTPLMPCARFDLDMVERDYEEPMRDRDKNFMAEQNEILCDPKNDPQQVRARAETKNMGKYYHDTNIPPNYWSPQFQSLIRKTRMFRTAKYISETYCVIDVFGIGISGRVAGSGTRMIILEAYSTWNCQKHVLVLTIPQLRQMFAGKDVLVVFVNRAISISHDHHPHSSY